VKELDVAEHAAKEQVAEVKELDVAEHVAKDQVAEVKELDVAEHAAKEQVAEVKELDVAESGAAAVAADAVHHADGSLQGGAKHDVPAGGDHKAAEHHDEHTREM
ncbi:uncharacterized protein Tco025E_09286, partial [Trypanosoma conorhini]